jgi:hypothetical protein
MFPFSNQTLAAFFAAGRRLMVYQRIPGNGGRLAGI